MRTSRAPRTLSKLVMAAAKVPEISEYSTDRGYVVRVGRRMVRFRTTDSLVTRPDWKIQVQKTGYISEAGRCLVMQTVIQDRTVVIVLLNSYGKRTRVADARRIRKWMEAKLTLLAAPEAATTRLGARLNVPQVPGGRNPRTEPPQQQPAPSRMPMSSRDGPRSR